MSLPDRLRQIERRITEIELGAGANGQAIQLVVVEVSARLSRDQAKQLSDELVASLAGTGARALVLGAGAKLARPSDAQIEKLQQTVEALDAKVAALIDALAQDGEDEEQPVLTLDGDQAGAERDQTQSLG